MNRTLLHTIMYIPLLLAGTIRAAGATAEATTAAESAAALVSDATLTRSGNYMEVRATLLLSGLSVRSNQAVLLQPRLVAATDTLTLPAVAIYGRGRYYHYLRANGTDMLSGPEETTLRAPDLPEVLDYAHVVPFAPWMDGSTLTLTRSDFGCCNATTVGEPMALAGYAEPRQWFPTLVYVQPTADAVKVRSIEGSAYIDFPVDRTEIHPDYRRNAQELSKIQATIDSVRSDADVAIQQVWLKGYASPESPYAHNADLARGRTNSLRAYIQQLYDFADTLVATDYEPEDWAGLRSYVAAGNLANRAAILALIDSTMDPDRKEQRIKTLYPGDYRFLLQNCYPALRHTDYRIAYTVRSFSDPAEIMRLMRTAPQKLSLNELYLASRDLEPGSDEFTELFETAVRMYPADPAANINAANAALRRDDIAAADRYLERAGTSAEAIYARAARAIRAGDTDAARPLLRQAAALGLDQAQATLDQLDE